MLRYEGRLRNGPEVCPLNTNARVLCDARLAQVNAALDRMEEARSSVERLLELYPNFERDVYKWLANINIPDEMTEAGVELYRKAGLNIPEKPD
jgi:hypothetical protein